MEPAGLTANWDRANGAESVPSGAGARGDVCLSLTSLGGCSPTDFSARWKSAAHLSALSLQTTGFVLSLLPLWYSLCRYIFQE